ncbi:MAG: SGNH/GDSL hydrolase family protein [Butyrivibrio sp.]|nr:SGNH/GDSL hydrolase family protein [Butyrivibrio sp.]
MEQKFIKSFFIRSAALLFAIIAVIVIFDPFYQYHKPLPGLKSVLTDKEYQCVGTLRNFDYDSLIVGSSVCENYNNRWFSDGFDCTAIKAIRSYGATADLCYLLDIAYQSHDIKYVFYNIDPPSLCADTETTFELTGCPMYLYDTNYLNDVPYVLNKDILMEKIPYMLFFSLQKDYDEGTSYNWAQDKSFNAEQTLGFYGRPSTVTPMYEETRHADKLAENIELLTSLIEAHPETNFKFFFSPYSMLWWDYNCRSGERDAYLYNEEQAVAAILQYENTEVYFYQGEEEIIVNLDNYMDPIHFSADINHLLCDKMIAGEGRLTLDNYKDAIQSMYELTEKIEGEYILEYFP